MLNRTVESLFWIGRYAERAENHARLFDVFYHFREVREFGEETVWKRLVGSVGDPASYEKRYGEYTESDVLTYIALDRDHPNSLMSIVMQARTNLRTIREKMPTELWDGLNGFYLWLKDNKPDDLLLSCPHMFFRRVREAFAEFQGTVQSIMLRDSHWHWMEAGRYLERCENTLRLLESVHLLMKETEGSQTSQLRAVLNAVGADEAYRRLVSDQAKLSEVAVFLLSHEWMPRSVLYSSRMLEEHLESVRASDRKLVERAYGKPYKLVGKMITELEMVEEADVLGNGLADLLSRLGEMNRMIGQSIKELFFHQEQGVIA